MRSNEDKNPILKTKGSNTPLKLAPLPAKFVQITEENQQEDVISKFSNEAVLPFAASPLFETTIKNTATLTQGENVKKVLEIEFYSNDFDYIPGDTIGILPPNFKEEVDYILDRCSLTKKADIPISMQSTESKKPIPKYIPKISTYRNILTWNLNIRAIPKKGFLRTLSECSSNPEEKIRLQELCSTQLAEDYRYFILNPGLTFIELLKLFESCHPKIEQLIENLPQLLPRSYSLSSTPKNKSSFTITLSIEINGICSLYLNQQSSLETKLENLSLKEKNTIHYYFRKSNSFHLPKDNVPVIMIAAGTGLAPFMGFIRHRQKGTEMWLFFGSRYEHQDYLYKTELADMVESQILTKLVVAFSKDKGEYIQDKLEIWKIELWDLIDKKHAKVFVCGDVAKVVKGTRQSFLNCLMANMSEEEAKLYLQEMIKDGRYVEDVWS